MSDPQIRFVDLLKNDPIFKAWFMKPPILTVSHTNPPWRLFVQKVEGGPWARRDYRTYAEAYTQVKLRLSVAHDLAVHSKPQHFQPPVVKVGGKRQYNPMPDNHTWCSLCRRPTRTIFVALHPNFGPKRPCDPEEGRCLICGCRRVGMKRYPSPLTWPLAMK